MNDGIDSPPNHLSPQQHPQHIPQPTLAYQQPMLTGNTMIPVSQTSQEKDIVLKNIDALEAGFGKKSGLEKLDEQVGIFVKQKIDMSALARGCESQNKYHVHALNPDNMQKGRQIFKGKENSTFCTRYCVPGDCRPFTMNVATTTRFESEDEYEPFLVIDRPYTCTCLCLNRPELTVTIIEGGRSDYIGRITEPFNCCNLQLDLYNRENQLRYTIKGKCCQLGVWCRVPCGPCQIVEFDVILPTGEIVSSLRKSSPGCLKSAVTDVEVFELNFPKECTAIDKTLLMSAVLFLDYRHFETNPNRDY